MSETDLFRIAFVELSVFEDGAIRGGMLVTDEHTRPYEFRVTSAIKPTPMQKIMYGLTLKEYVYSDLIGLPLLKSAKETVSIAFVRDTNLIGTRPHLNFPIAYLHKLDQAADTQTEALRFTLHNQFKTEEDWIGTVIQKISSQLDLLEPFERVRTALIEVHKWGPEEKRSEAVK